ncbi:hypothetical protein ACA910_004844 [Epithemia clementina (nom. ined.)]
MLSLSNDADPSSSSDAENRRNANRNADDAHDRDRDEAATAEDVTPHEDWGIVEISSTPEESEFHNQTGILILSGENHADTSGISISSENEPPIQTALSSPMESDTTYLVEDLSEQESTRDSKSMEAEEDERELDSSPSIPSDVPSNLDNLDSLSRSSEDPTHHFNNNADYPATPYRAAANTIPTQDVTFNSFSYNDHDDKESQGQSEALRTLSDELAVVEAIFRYNKSRLLKPCTLLCVALGIASCLTVGSFFIIERRAWQASSRRLEERIEQLQLELLRKLDSEKHESIQRNLDFEYLRQEFKEALQNRKSAENEHERKSHDSDCHSSPNRRFPSTSFFSETSTDEKEENNVLFENCWIQAEAKLGECALEARNAFKSKFQTFGRSLWHAQEQVVERVNDFGKRIHTAAKEAAERVVMEAEQYSKNSSDNNSDESKNYKQGTSTNYQTVATTLVSSVALASLAAVVADQASAYIASFGGSQDQ